MTLLFVILIIIFSFVLGLIVLIQNPKGGGLAGSFGGISTQFMGVKQTTDVLEKGTWIFAGLIGLLCVLSSFFMSSSVAGATDTPNSNAAGAPMPQSPAKNNQATFPTTVPGTTPPATTTPATGAGDTTK
jgi:preprotein translocase subunit SecG